MRQGVMLVRQGVMLMRQGVMSNRMEMANTYRPCTAIPTMAAISPALLDTKVRHKTFYASLFRTLGPFS